MNQFTTDIMQALVKKDDITEVFRLHLEAAVNTVLKSELTAFLDYDKYDWIGCMDIITRHKQFQI